MALTIINPENSFVRINEIEPEPQCGRSINLCLPVYLETDIRFELFVTAGLLENVQLYARIVANCNAAVPTDYTPTTGALQLTALPKNERLQPYVATLTNLSQDDLNAIPCGDCFYLQILRATQTRDDENPVYQVVGCSNCFYRICNPCFTSVISYRCNEDAFGFQYYEVVGGGGRNSLADFYNVIRLPFYLKEPQFPKKKNVFVKSDGSRKTLSSRIEKEYSGKTDYMPEQWHERLVIALEHDTVKIESVDAPVTPAREFVCESSYDIDWQSFLNYPTAPAKFKVKLTPYNNYNSNCN